ncbi:DUF732 domain-containing protein [Mycobacterium intracellulare]|uniref:DUF732 domain-containing protein n=1 Tax=Mycobacterium intracellulare TaxID=1767 RepID=UPI00355683C3
MVISAVLDVSPAAAADPADGGDDLYILELSGTGLTPAVLGVPNYDAAIHVGHLICSDLHHGEAPNDEVSDIVQHRPNLRQQTLSGVSFAQLFISAAVTSYCNDVGLLPWSPKPP